MFGMEFYVDPSRCIGCQSCLKACEECDTHRGVSMINFDFIDRQETIATAAYVCWHCDDPTCAQVMCWSSGSSIGSGALSKGSSIW